MAKKFAGFTPQQQHKLLSKMGYSGSEDIGEMNKYLQDNPEAMTKLGKYAAKANERIRMKDGGYVTNPDGTMSAIKDDSLMNSTALPTGSTNPISTTGTATTSSTGSTTSPDGTVTNADGTVTLPSGQTIPQSLYDNLSGWATATGTGVGDGTSSGSIDWQQYSSQLPTWQQGTMPIGYVPTSRTGGGFNEGAYHTYANMDQQQYQNVLWDNMVQKRQAVTELQQQLANDPGNARLQGLLENAQADFQNAYTSYQANAMPGYEQSLGESYTGQNVTQAEAAQINQEAGQMIDPATGQVVQSAQATAGQAGPAAQATTPDQFDPATYQAATSYGEAQNIMDGTQAAQGTVSKQVEAATLNPEELAQLGLDAAQIEQYQKAVAAKRTLQQGEMIEGSAVDMAEVTKQAQFDAAQADPSKQATVKGQLESLMKDFEGGETPAWAAGAMRNAMGELQARGLGASSIAGQAVIQAAMESALPIAMQDAQTYASFEAQNLSNRQQAAMFGAQQRAQFLGMKFDQEFQSRVLNAAKISDIANMNFTAEQQVALENARLAQSVDLANLNARQAKIMADAAAMTQTDLTNLSNRQQARVQNAQNFLQMDLSNLSNRQQTALFKSQALMQSLLSDTAAENAALQFNAASENQVNTFFADLEANISQFNADQQNAINMFNAEEAGATSRFNANMENMRLQFNATQRLAIAQANAVWRQNIATQEFQAQHDSNMEYASTLNAFSQTAMDEIWQRERDIMSFSWQSGENAAERATSLLLGEKNLEGIEMQLDAEEDAAMGGLVYNVLFGSGGGGGGGLFGGDGLLGGLF